jgi:integron integrase
MHFLKGETGGIPKSETGAAAKDERLNFPGWSEAMVAAGWTAEVLRRRQLAVMRLLKHAKAERRPVSVSLMKELIAQAEAEGTLWPETREAWRWFVIEARKRAVVDGGEFGKSVVGNQGKEVGQQGAGESRPVMGTRDVPSHGAEDQGGPEWERALITRLRREGKLWRTEQTYRGWAWRFADFLRPGSPEEAGPEQVKAFLNDLAVRLRVAPSTQKQALNAVVYLLQGALGRDLGDFSDFERATPKRRVPVVLTREEAGRLVQALDGTLQLMALVGYGAGLRLMELLRLRVKDVDLDRRQVVVRGGKGDKDRVTVLPERAVEPLRVQRERLRGLWEADRAAGVPGVWLPEGLERKLGRAGEEWVWQWFWPSKALSLDPQSGLRRRHHVSDRWFQNAIKAAAMRAGIDKRVSPHVLRHCFGTHLLEGGTDIRTVQELMGHAKVETTQIYLHVMKKPGLGVRSPLDG